MTKKVVACLAVAVVMIIAAALATTTMTDAAMADVTVMTAIAPEILIAMRAVGVMIAMEVVVIAAVIAAVTAAAIVVAVATMIEAMIGAASLLLLETIHANLTAEAAETTAAATTATQVGRLFHHMSTRDRPVSSGSRAYDSFRTQVMSPATSRFRIPICIPRFFRRLDGKLETASNSIGPSTDAQTEDRTYSVGFSVMYLAMAGTRARFSVRCALSSAGNSSSLKTNSFGTSLRGHMAT